MARRTWFPILAMAAAWACSGGRTAPGTDLVTDDLGILAEEVRDDVDAKRIGITGGSAGAMVSLIASGADDRIRAAVPFSGTRAFAERFGPISRYREW